MPKKTARIGRGKRKKWPCQVIRWAKKCNLFFPKVSFFALFALNFPHLGFHFGAQKAALYKGISKIQFKAIISL